MKIFNLIIIFLTFFSVAIKAEEYKKCPIHGVIHLKDSIQTKNPFGEYVNTGRENFFYVEFSGFPTELDYNTFGAALGYRLAGGPFSASDYSFHIMRDHTGEIHICAKANQLFFVRDRATRFCPYVGFGVLAGISPEDRRVDHKFGKVLSETIDKEDYNVFLNAEIVVGVEFQITGESKQFLELTYYAQSTTIQISLGFGF